MAVGYTAKDDSFAAGKPRVWSDTRLRDTCTSSPYDLAPDGKRLAAMLLATAHNVKSTRVLGGLNHRTPLHLRSEYGSV
jgi:hypothetical protein